MVGRWDDLCCFKFKKMHGVNIIYFPGVGPQLLLATDSPGMIRFKKDFLVLI